MSCRATRARLVAWQDGELSPGEDTRVEEHLAVCAECRRLEARLARATPGPAEPLPAGATEALFARMDAALEEAWQHPAPARARRADPTLWWDGETRLPRAALVAYAALLFLTAAWGTWQWRAAQAFEAELQASRPAIARSVVPARGVPTPRTEATDLSADQFAPAAFVPDPDAD